MGLCLSRSNNEDIAIESANEKARRKCNESNGPAHPPISFYQFSDIASSMLLFFYIENNNEKKLASRQTNFLHSSTILCEKKLMMMIICEPRQLVKEYKLT